METDSALLIEAIRIIKERSAHLASFRSVEPIDRDRLLVTLAHGSWVFRVARLPDGKIELAEEPAPNVLN